MYRKRLILIFFCIVLLAFTCVGLSSYIKKNVDVQYMDSSTDNKGESVITRALAAKMLALLYYSHSEIVNMPEITQYSDLEDNNWYNKYFYALDELGVIWGTDKCRPQDNLTCKEAECLYNYFMQNIYGGEDGLTQSVSDAAMAVSGAAISSSDTAISADMWMQIYDSLRNMDRTRELKRETVFLMSLIENEEEWCIATDRGNYYFDGYAMDAYTNTSIEILTDGEEVIYIYGQKEGGSKLISVLLTAQNDHKMTVFCNDVTMELALTEEVEDNEEIIEFPVVADINVSNGIITDMSVYSDKKNDKILAVTDSYIDMQGQGRLGFADGCHIYNTISGLRSAEIEDISVGYSVADVVIDKDCNVKAVLVSGEIKPDNIRVAIMTSGYKSLYHSEVSVSSDAGFVVTNGNNSYEYKAGEFFSINKSDEMISNSRITIVPAGDSKLLLNSISRSYGNPEYRGSIELMLYDEGIVIINELSVEQYLYSVVPSEMPSSYGIEPLKAQAVCARGYAYMQINNCRLGNIGAHVDDSTSFQVYNNTRETENSIAAVDATIGQVLQYDNKMISPYYFSTSCGMTADCDDVWSGMKHVPYLEGKLQDTSGQSSDIDLSDEKKMKQFIDNPFGDTYDSSFPWYRWSVSLYSSDIKESIENSIAVRYKVNPKHILTKNKNEKYISKNIKTVGEIKDIKISKRAKSGIVTEIIITGTKKTIKVKSEYNIRLLLASSSMRITRNDNSTVDGLTIMPSAFFYIDVDTSSGQSIYTFKGGGYGHGVGMSQNGAKAMAEAGYDYIGILSHYYSGCSVSALSL